MYIFKERIHYIYIFIMDEIIEDINIINIEPLNYFFSNYTLPSNDSLILEFGV